MDDLKDMARKLPPAKEAQGKSHHMMRQRNYPVRYNDLSYYADEMMVDKVSFHNERGHLDGTVVWYWTYQGVIVRVDV
jgi:predicted methyltransferase